MQASRVYARPTPQQLHTCSPRPQRPKWLGNVAADLTPFSRGERRPLERSVWSLHPSLSSHRVVSYGPPPPPGSNPDSSAPHLLLVFELAQQLAALLFVLDVARLLADGQPLCASRTTQLVVIVLHPFSLGATLLYPPAHRACPLAVRPRWSVALPLFFELAVWTNTACGPIQTNSRKTLINSASSCELCRSPLQACQAV